MKTQSKNELIKFMLVFLFLFTFWITASFFEAKAFRKISGQHVTMWDAMFLSLRVGNCGPDGES